MNKQENKINPMEEARKLRTWIKPKEVQIHTLKQNIKTLELQISHIEINIKDGWFIEQQKKRIKEAQSEYERKIAELDLEQLESDIEKGFIGRLEQIKLEELQTQLEIEEKSLQELNKRITMAMRNHKVPKTEDQSASQDQAKGNDAPVEKEERETHAGGTAEEPTYEKHGFGRLPPKGDGQ